MSNYDLNDLPEDVLKEHLQLTERLEEIERVDTCQNNFLEFVAKLLKEDMTSFKLEK